MKVRFDFDPSETARLSKRQIKELLVALDYMKTQQEKAKQKR